MCKKSLKRNCKTNCPIPKLANDNYIIFNIICKYASILYNGESISAEGIRLALDNEEIKGPDRSVFTRLIQVYFLEVSKIQSEELKKETKKPGSKF